MEFALNRSPDMSPFKFRLHRIQRFKNQQAKLARQTLQQCQKNKIHAEQKVALLVAQIQNQSQESIQGLTTDSDAGTMTTSAWLANQNYIDLLTEQCKQAVTDRQKMHAAWQAAKDAYERLAVEIKAMNLLEEQQQLAWDEDQAKKTEVEHADNHLRQWHKN